LPAQFLQPGGAVDAGLLLRGTDQPALDRTAPRLRTQTIGAAATPIDGLLNGVLTTLGLRLGQADTWVMGVRCGTPSLVR
jgi:uncharacterized membrane protein